MSYYCQKYNFPNNFNYYYFSVYHVLTVVTKLEKFQNSYSRITDITWVIDDMP